MNNIGKRPPPNRSFSSLLRAAGVLGLGLLAGYYFYNIKNSNVERVHKSTHGHLRLDDIMPPSGHILKSIAVPRVSGTLANAQVRSFIKSNFNEEYWDIEEDVHLVDSQHGSGTTFTNLIFPFKTKSADPAAKRIILSAHYDSKLLEAEGMPPDVSIEGMQSEFIGAIDSAWSCALMIGIAQAIEREVIEKQQIVNEYESKLGKSKIKSNEISINFQLVFFDGEEAVKRWSQDDSLYGSRALANKWSQLPVSDFNSLPNIKCLILLDLLGASENDFYDFNPMASEPSRMFRRLAEIEAELFAFAAADTKLFKSTRRFDGMGGLAVEDDHTPFIPFGVPILHLIPIPFPQVWHTPRDTIDALKENTCERLSIVLYEFMRLELLT